MRPLADAIRGSRWELFRDASHSTHLEQPEPFLELVEGFLAGWD